MHQIRYHVLARCHFTGAHGGDNGVLKLADIARVLQHPLAALHVSDLRHHRVRPGLHLVRIELIEAELFADDTGRERDGEFLDERRFKIGLSHAWLRIGHFRIPCLSI